MTESASLNRIVSALGVLSLSLPACRPVLTVGWVEIFILFAMVAFLFGPLLFHLFTWWQKYREQQRSTHKPEK